MDDSLVEGDEALSIEGSAAGLSVTGTAVTIEDDETASTEVTLSGGLRRRSEDGCGCDDW